MHVLHLQYHWPAIDVDLCAVGVLDGRVVALDPFIVHELSSKTAFAHTTCSEYDNVELAGRLVATWSRRHGDGDGDSAQLDST
jgi:hypothetical protein